MRPLPISKFISQQTNAGLSRNEHFPFVFIFLAPHLRLSLACVLLAFAGFAGHLALRKARMPGSPFPRFAEECVRFGQAKASRSPAKKSAERGGPCGPEEAV
jgi:hypothetical protein